MTLQLASRWSRVVAAMAHCRMGIITWLRSRVTGLRWMNLQGQRGGDTGHQGVTGTGRARCPGGTGKAPGRRKGVKGSKEPGCQAEEVVHGVRVVLEAVGLLEELEGGDAERLGGGGARGFVSN